MSNNQQQPKNGQRIMLRKDAEGRIHRFVDKEYTPRPGYYRLTWLEKPYFWWKFKSFDFKNAIIPIFISFVFGGIIFNASMEWSQREVEREIKATLPQQFNKRDIAQYLKKREQERKTGGNIQSNKE